MVEAEEELVIVCPFRRIFLSLSGTVVCSSKNISVVFLISSGFTGKRVVKPEGEFCGTYFRILAL